MATPRKRAARRGHDGPTRNATSQRQVYAAFAAADILHAAGLYSEVVEHALFSPLGWCCCSRCRYYDEVDGR